MLTPTDIHYLVGLLSLSSGPDNVDVVLGDLVLDDAAAEARDVDVTITTKDSAGQISAYHGMEVKAHGRPLDTTHVEQLCAKFGDMPALTSHSIVSASGYTAPAKLKAERHGVALWSLRKWEDPSRGFDHVRFPKDMPFVTHWFDPAGQPSVTFRRVDRQEGGPLEGATPVRMHDGTEHPSLSTVRAWADHLVIQSINRVTSDPANQEKLFGLGDGQVVVLPTITAELDQPLLIGEQDQQIAVDGAFVATAIISRIASTQLDFRILTQEGSEDPFAAAESLSCPWETSSRSTRTRRTRIFRF